MANILEGFQFTRILNEDPASKTIFILGKKLSDLNELKDAIIIAEKLHFNKEEIPFINGNSGRLVDLNSTGANDIYHWFKSKLNSNFASSEFDVSAIKDIKLQLIFPATDNHISKYSFQSRFMIEETSELFEKVVSPAINSIPSSAISWVYNIIEGRKEQESILYKDTDPETGFLLLPDSKWDRVTFSSLYLLVIVNRRDIRCLRDMRKQHLPLLKKIVKQVPIEIEKMFPGQISPNELRLYVHYLPTYYHFHVHVVHTQNLNAPGMTVGQSHLVSTIIENIDKIDENYYSKVTLHYSLGEKHPVYCAIESHKQSS